VFEERAIVVRPGLIVGPHDPTGRFTYWPHRVARGGEVLAPAPPERLTQAVDVRDLGEWIVLLCEQGTRGTFNATNPGFAWSALVDACTAVSGSNAEITWVSEAFLLEHEVGQWMELPLWIADPTMTGAVEANVRRALEVGLTFRALEETARGALEDANTTDTAGLAPEREAELLAAWHARE
jgi:2'-hydroxyisoflavone reductase